ncbi:hypothetical protein T05_13096 [Trichinella murrelli]|uniref:Uncharacterized protein n=1 Tax=Trichinella murrelli TaxID=144512 RepID=A0A0V0SV16_9BILA|nr:hypothetical protein T05_13096 [Trichinella murrelli]
MRILSSTLANLRVGFEYSSSSLVLLSLAQHYSFVNKLCRLSIEFSLSVIVTQVGLSNALDFAALQ